MIYKNAKIGDKITDIAVKDRKIVSLEKTSDDGIDLRKTGDGSMS